MSSRKPELIVPVRDRRQRRRILTLKNFGFAAVALVALFALVSIYAKLRSPKPADDYGRLYKGQIKVPNVAKPPEIVQDSGPIADADGADPTLLSAAARAQYLGADTNMPGQTTTTTTTTTVTTSSTRTAAPLPAQTSTAPKSESVTIVGGAEGVAIVKEKHEQPVLSGGFGKPPG